MACSRQLLSVPIDNAAGAATIDKYMTLQLPLRRAPVARVAWLLALTLQLAGITAASADNAELVAYLNDLGSFSAQFEQIRRDEDGVEIERSNGDCQIKRPGRFRWNYVKPYPQLIVSDGRLLSIFDPDLEQVTLSEIGEFPHGSPAALLGEDIDVGDNFDVETIATPGARDATLTWFALRPKNAAGDFNLIELGLGAGEVRAMRLADKLGQMTELHFSDITRNATLDDAQFEFTPPPGVDVVTAPTAAP